MIAADVDVPLGGPSGAARGFGPQKFARPDQVAAEELIRLEEHLDHLVAAVDRRGGRTGDVGPSPDPDSLGPDSPDADSPDSDTTETGTLRDRPGAGSAGGLGWALLVLGGRMARGAAVVAESVDLSARLDEADLVVTGEGGLDWQSRRGKVVAEVARRAADRGVPVIALAGRVDLGGRELGAMGISEAHGLVDQAGGPQRAWDRPAEALADLAQQVAIRWSGPGAARARGGITSH